MWKDTTTLLLLLLICHSCYSQISGSRSRTDPCRDYTVLKNITNRDPKTPGRPLLIDDSKLAPGWYGAPGKWELLNRDPGGTNRCGTQIPVYRSQIFSTTSLMCNKVQVRNCYRPFNITTKKCGSKEIYYLKTSHRRSGFCFFDNSPCARNPCANGGTCKDRSGGGYICACSPGFTGQNCETCNRKKLDILIMEDESLSVGQTTFDKVSGFQERLLSPLKIGAYGDRIAYMVFSKIARVVFSFKKYKYSKSSVLAALKNQTYENGDETNIDKAIDMAVDSVFKASNGDRQSIANVVIMFTDGLVTDEDREAINANVGRLHAIAEVFVVAISDVEANSTVYSLASNSGNIFRIGSNAAVHSIQSRLRGCQSNQV